MNLLCNAINLTNYVKQPKTVTMIQWELIILKRPPKSAKTAYMYL